MHNLEFDLEYGTPDYKNISVVAVFQYNKSSIDGVPYGIAFDTDKFDLAKTINIPENTEIGYFRTTISGWGHLTVGNCAE